MSFFIPEQKSNWRNEMPAGAIKSAEEMLDLVIEARKEKKAIRIYTVSQSGHLSCFYIYSKTKLYRPGGKHPNPTYDSLDNTNHVLYPILKDHSLIGYKQTNNRWFKGDELLESYIPALSKFKPTEHRMFQNKKHAENYSKALSSDPQYMLEVKQWHEYCRKSFSSFDWGMDGDY